MAISFVIVSLMMVALFFGLALGIRFQKLNLKKKDLTRYLKNGLIIFSVIFIADVLLQSFPEFSPFYIPVHFETNSFSSVPGYLGFIATAATGIFIYQTLKSQQETLIAQNRSLDEQKRANQITEFESRFFKFIDYHRENVSQLKYRKPKEAKDEYFEGNQVFTVIYYEIIELLEEYIKNRYRSQAISREKKIVSINFIYQCVFFGAGRHSFGVLATNFPCTFFDYIDFKGRKAAYDYDGKKHVFYSGHVRRLGHYFRNLYQAISYVEGQSFLSEKEKYEYVTTLRAQMSVYEQAVFFFNSISDLGSVWELKEYEQDFPVDESRKKEVFKELWITKYDLVRNTLNNDGVICEGISIKDFYPLINLERENEFTQSCALPFENNTGDKGEHICRLCFNEKYIGYIDDDNVKREVKQVYNSIDELKKHVRCNEANCVTEAAFNS